MNLSHQFIHYIMQANLPEAKINQHPITDLKVGLEKEMKTLL